MLKEVSGGINVKYLLVIGAGDNQVPVIKAAKELGCYVYVVTIPGDYEGIRIADEWINLNIFDKEKIVELFRNGDKPIDGVVSDQSDMAAPIVGYVADELGLPSWGYENALKYTDKDKMRALFGEVKLPVPAFVKVPDAGEAVKAAEKIGYPVVFKPTNSFSSRGITLVRCEEEVKDAYLSAYNNSRTREVIAEKYIEGKQYFSQGFVSDHKLNMFAFSDRYYYDLPDVFIPYTNCFPAEIDESLRSRMVADFNKIIDATKPRFGHVWAEWIHDDVNDELYIVEIAMRGGGAHVTTDLIPHAYGVDTQPLLVKEALGIDTRFYEYEDFDNKAAAFYSFLLPEGIITSVSGLEEASDIPGVVSMDLKEMKVGDRTVKIKDKTSRYGLVVVYGENRQNLEETRKKLKETIKVTVETPEGIKGVIWE